MKADTMDTVEAIRMINAALSQWRECLRDPSFDLAQYRDLLAQDMESMANAAGVLTDWLS